MKATQRIICDPWPDHPCVGDSITIAAKATSGLPVHVMVLAGPAVIAENRLTFPRPGEVKIKLTQDGNDDFESAPDIQVTLNVTKANQTIVLEPLSRDIFSGDRIVMKAVATSGLPVTFHILAGPAELSGGRVAIITGTGLVEIEAHQAGNDKFLAAKAKVSWTAIKRPQEIILWEGIRDRKAGEPPFIINATATSGLPVSLSVVSGPARIRNHHVTLTGAGRVVIQAAQAGDGGYASAEAVRSFTVEKGHQTIDFEAAPAALSPGETYALQARASSGLPLTFSVLTGNARISGNQLTAEAAGSVTIQATQIGNEDYEPAEALQSFTVAKTRQTLSFKTLPGEIMVGNSCTLEAVASSGSAVTFSLVSGSATISGHELTPTAAGVVVIKAAQAGNETCEAAETVQSLVVLRAEQSISFDPLPNEATATESFPVRAKAGSGLPVSIDVFSGPAEIVDGQLILRGTGEVKIKATQSGDQNYSPAPEVVHTLTVVKARQTIGFEELNDRKVGEPPFLIEATATSGLPVSFSVVSGPARIKDYEVTLMGAGRVVIQAAQAGDGAYASAEVVRSFTVAKGRQTIRFEAAPGALSAGDTYSLQARASSGLPLTFSVQTGKASITGNQLTVEAAGSVTIKATQVGNEDYEPAEALQSFTVAKTRQTLSFKTLPGEIMVGNSYALEAAASSGLAVTFSLVSGSATISGHELRPTAAGRVVIKAAQAGNETCEAAEAVQSLVVLRAEQSISFDPLPNEATATESFPVRAKAGSGLPVSIDVFSGPAEIVNGQLILRGAGEVKIKATQSGDQNYSPASEVVHTLTVVKARQTIGFEELSDCKVGEPAFIIKATASSGLPVCFSVVSGPARIKDHEVTLMGAGRVVIQAAQAGDGAYASAEVVRSFTVAKGRQTIRFEAAPGALSAGDTYSLQARASSGLPLTFSVQTGKASITGNQLTVEAGGSVTIKATQIGNEDYEPAEALQSFTVAKTRQTLSFKTLPGEIMVGNSYALEAAASSGLAVTFSLVSGSATISGHELRPTAAGRAVIKAVQAGNETYEAAEEVQSLVVPRAEQSISFDALQNEATASESIPVRAKASSGLPVSIDVHSGPAEIVNGQLILRGAGEVKIKATQSGDQNYSPASEVVHTLTVVKARQTIGFEELSDCKVGEPPLLIKATASSGLPVSFSVVSGPAKIKDHEMTLTGAGRVVIQAAQAGDGAYASAEVVRSFTVAKGRQTIRFEAAPGALSAGDTYSLQARASSGLPLTFSVQTGKASITGNQLTVEAAGSVAIKATQIGNEDYEPAEALQSFTVAKTRQTLSFKTLPGEIMVGNSCTLEAVASSGLAVTFSLVSGSATISGDELTPTAAGVLAIKAAQAGNEMYEAAEAVQSLVVLRAELKAEQSISFDALPNEATASESIPVRAKASSGLPVSIDVLSGPAEIVDGQLILQGAGEVKIKATQSGDENYGPAAEVVQTLTVVKAPQTIRFDLTGGNFQAGESILLTATASSGQPVTFRLLSGPAELYGETLVGTGAGRVEIVAEQDGDGKYEAAKTQRSLLVVKRSQEILFEELKDRKVGEPAFIIKATATSGLPVSLSVASGPANLNGCEVTLSRRGKVQIIASQAGDDVYKPAPDVERDFYAKDPSRTRAVIAGFLGVGLILVVSVFLLWPSPHPTPSPKPGPEKTPPLTQKAQPEAALTTPQQTNTSAEANQKIKEAPATVPVPAEPKLPAEIKVAEQDKQKIKEAPAVVPVTPEPKPPAETKVAAQDKPKVKEAPTTVPVAPEPNPPPKTTAGQEPTDQVVVSAEAKTKVYGAATPPLTAKCSVALNDWETLSHNLTVKASTVSNLTPVGVYEITVEGPPRFGTHAVSYLKDKMTVTRAPLRITPQSISLTNGDAVPPFSFNYSGWVNNEDERVLTQRPQVTNLVSKLPAGGPYAIQACCASSPNYEISYGNGWVRVEAAPIVRTNQESVAAVKTNDSASDVIQVVSACDAELEVLLRLFDLWNKEFVVRKGIFKADRYSLLDTKPQPLKGAIPQLKKKEYLQNLDDLQQKLRQAGLLDNRFKPQLEHANQTRNELIIELRNKIAAWQTSD